PKADANKDIELPTLGLDRAGSVTGVTVDTAGSPVAGAEVFLVVANDRDLRARTEPITSDGAGKFTLKNLDPTDTVALRARTDRA
ncbi:UNVERIFIED_CONTAM: carboxypeptidase-like regulatory domain-containing protein, partial [Campylobacter jejuni]